ncbi:MAG: DUF2164 family protein [Crocinitomicaceae bacterium]|nr:DUF2164 family protein [Crocinitomicaceae bacterium]
MGLINDNGKRLSEEERRILKDELIQFFENERDEKIGVIAAEELLNFFLLSAGKMLYNKGVNDAKKVIETRTEEIRFDLDDLLEL